jgi:hypothetical protein
VESSAGNKFYGLERPKSSTELHAVPPFWEDKKVSGYYMLVVSDPSSATSVAKWHRHVYARKQGQIFGIENQDTSTDPVR